MNSSVQIKRTEAKKFVTPVWYHIKKNWIYTRNEYKNHVENDLLSILEQCISNTKYEISAGTSFL